jgi:hypothetical protein
VLPSHARNHAYARALSTFRVYEELVDMVVRRAVHSPRKTMLV